KLTDWVLNSHMTLTAFDAYPLGRPKIDEIQWKFILDTNVMIANVLAGAANMTIGRGISLQQSLEAADRLGNLGKPDYYSLGWVALFPQFINPNPAAIGNVQVSRALLHALARQQATDLEYRATRPGFEMTRQPDDFSDRSLRRLLSREASIPENNFRGQNRGRYQSPELDSLIERYLVTVPMRERLDIGRGIVKHMTENLPVMGVAYDSTAIIIGSSLTNVNALEITRNVHTWDVR